MRVGAGVNERLAALTEAGTSVWLDQIRRSLIESGELERLERSCRSAGSPRTRPSSRRRSSARPTTTSRSRSSPGRAWTRGEIYEEIAIKDVQLACDVLRPVWDQARAATGSCRSRWSRRSRTTPKARSSRRATSGSASTGPT